MAEETTKDPGESAVAAGLVDADVRDRALAFMAGETQPHPQMPERDRRRPDLDLLSRIRSKFADGHPSVAVVEGRTSDGTAWTARMLCEPRLRSKALIEVSTEAGSAFWRVVDVRTGLAPMPENEDGFLGRRGFSAPAEGSGVHVRVSDHQSVHVHGEDRSEPDVGDGVVRVILPEVAEAFVRLFGGRIRDDATRNRIEYLRNGLGSWLRAGDALADADSDLVRAEEGFRGGLDALPPTVRRRTEAMDLAAIAVETEYAADGTLGVLLLSPHVDKAGFSVRPTARRSAYRSVGEMSVSADGPHVLRDGTVRGSRFHGCGREEGEEQLRETVRRLLAAKPWVFDREDLGAAAEALIEARKKADEARIGFGKSTENAERCLRMLEEAQAVRSEHAASPDPLLEAHPAIGGLAPRDAPAVPEDAEPEQAAAPSLW